MYTTYILGSWRNIITCALLWSITTIATNIILQDSAQAQSQLRDISVSWDDGHGTINSMSGGTYTESNWRGGYPDG